MRTEKWWAGLNSNTSTDGTYNILFVSLGNKFRSESTTPADANTAATAKSNFPTGNKRARAENEATNMTTDSAQENSSQKRKRLRSILSSNNEDMRGVTPVSIETEDISEEVQRRLEIKEEQRKKRGTSTSEKRKRNRDSLASNDSTSSSFGGASRPKKRRRELGTAKADWKLSSSCNIPGGFLDTIEVSGQGETNTICFHPQSVRVTSNAWTEISSLGFSYYQSPKSCQTNS